MPPTSAWLNRAARREVRHLLRSLPREVRQRAETVAVILEPKPGRALLNSGLPADSLGVFEGRPLAPGEEADSLFPPRITLFLDNLWAAAADEPRFREEVRTTCLHELGHFLGLDEADLAARALD